MIDYFSDWARIEAGRHFRQTSAHTWYEVARERDGSWSLYAKASRAGHLATDLAGEGYPTMRAAKQAAEDLGCPTT